LENKRDIKTKLNKRLKKSKRRARVLKINSIRRGKNTRRKEKNTSLSIASPKIIHKEYKRKRQYLENSKSRFNI
jgi:hypothetical protein